MAQFAAERAEPAATTANPAPLGLSAFALTTFVLSAINAGWFPAAITATIVAPALFYGGAIQVLAGMWEFRAGNTFGATAFTSYGAFWLGVAAYFIPGTGIGAAIGTNIAGLHAALGLFLLGWTIFTALMFLGTLRTNLALMGVFLFLLLAFIALTIGELFLSSAFHVLGGYLGIITALLAWYTALAGILASGKQMFTLPTMPRN